MLITERSVGDITILDLQGRFIDDREEIFRETMNRLVRERKLKVVLNLDGVNYVDSAGVGMLVSRYIRLKTYDGELKLCNMNRKSFRVLDVTNLLTVFESYDSELLAVRSFGSATDAETTQL